MFERLRSVRRQGADRPFAAGHPLCCALNRHDVDTRLVTLLTELSRAAPTGAYLQGQMRSPIGYWAFEQPGPGDRSQCDDRSWLSLRWNMSMLQDHYPPRPLESERTRAALRWLTTDGPALGVERIFIEPYLAARLGVSSPVLGFQGCRAVRHDDHIHIEIK
jgi:hypothetical protein